MADLNLQETLYLYGLLTGIPAPRPASITDDFQKAWLQNQVSMGMNPAQQTSLQPGLADSLQPFYDQQEQQRQQQNSDYWAMANGTMTPYTMPNNAPPPLPELNRGSGATSPGTPSTPPMDNRDNREGLNNEQGNLDPQRGNGPIWAENQTPSFPHGDPFKDQSGIGLDQLTPPTIAGRGMMPAVTSTMTLGPNGTSVVQPSGTGLTQSGSDLIKSPMAEDSNSGTSDQFNTRVMDGGNIPNTPNTVYAPYGRVPSANTDGSDPYGDLFGLGPMPNIPDINLGEMPTMSGNFDPSFLSQYGANTDATANAIRNIFNGIQLPNAKASTIDLGQLSTLMPQQVGQSAALKRLLSGQGFDPATMARLNAGATDNISRQAGANRGSARLALEQAGLAGSPAEAAITGQINRQRGDATTQSLNQLAIENANRGLENFRQGAEMDFSRESNNMQQANAMALARSQQMLQAMQTNAANTQQSNMANFGAQTNRAMESGGRQADTRQQAGQQLGQAQLSRNTGAAQQNAANGYNWILNQANLDRGADTTNANLKQNAQNTGINGLLSLAGLQNPANYSNQGSVLTGQQQPTNLLGSVLGNIGAGALNKATA